MIEKRGLGEKAIYCDNCDKKYRRKYNILVLHEAREKGWFIEPHKDNGLTVCPSCVSKIIKEYLTSNIPQLVKELKDMAGSLDTIIKINKRANSLKQKPTRRKK